MCYAYSMTYDAMLIDRGECPELVWIDTEDGRVDGRCLAPITDDEIGACEGHAAEIRGWHAMSEAEKCAWERRQDEEDRF